MLHQLALCVLAPLLYWQGRHVRRVTPILPEAAGLRHGNSGQGTPLRLMILGDSAAAGVGVDEQQQALSGILSHILAQHHQLSWRLHAHSGYRLADVLAHCHQQKYTPIDAVVISVGVNDVSALCSQRRWLRQWQALITLLQQQNPTSHIYASAIPPMGWFPALPQPLRWWLGAHAATLNRRLQHLLAKHPNVHYLQPPYPKSLSLMASDGFHPGAQAYRLWGEYTAKAILQHSKPAHPSDHQP